MLTDVILVNGYEGLADAMAATSIDGQVLYVEERTRLGSKTRDEILRLDPAVVFIIGDDLLVALAVEDEIRGMGFTTKRLAGRTRVDTAISVSQGMFPDPIVVPPVIEPPIVTPPSGDLFIPKYQGAPILKHDGNPTIINGQTFDEGGIVELQNVLIRGPFRTKNNTTLIIRDGELDGLSREQCAAGWGGSITLIRCEVWNAEDGLKDSVNTEQCTIHNLFKRVGGHSDAHQMQSAGHKATHKFSYFEASYWNSTTMGNSPFIIKNDLGSAGTKQTITVEDSYFDMGNYSVTLKGANAGPPPDAYFRRCVWGGNARFGVKAGVPALEWDVKLPNGDRVLQNGDIVPA